MEKVSNRFKIQLAQFILSAVIFILLFVIGAQHAHKGFDFTDEGLYVSTPLRYALGDVPFKDELTTHVFSFDKLMSPVFVLFPQITLYQYRLLGLTIVIISLLILFLFLSRYAPPLLVAGVCALVFFTNNLWGLYSPSYNLLSSCFAIISGVSFFSAVLSRKRSAQIILSIVSGLFYGLIVICYSSFVLFFALPLALLILSLFNLNVRKLFFLPIVIFSVTFLMIMGSILIYLIETHVLQTFISGFLELSGSLSGANENVLVRFGKLFHEFNGRVPTNLLLSGLPLFGVLLLLRPKKSATNSMFDGLLILFFVIIFVSQFIVQVALPNQISLFFILLTTIIILLKQYQGGKGFSYQQNWGIFFMFAAPVILVLSILYHFSLEQYLPTLLRDSVPLLALLLIINYQNILLETVIAIGVCFFMYLSLFPYSDTNIQYATFITIAILLIFILHILVTKKLKASRDEWNLVFVMALVWHFLVFFIYGYSSSNPIRAASQGIIPLFAYAFVASYRLIERYSAQFKISFSRRIVAQSVLVTCLIALIVSGYQYYTKYVYLDAPIDQLTTGFTFPKLKGVETTAKKVSELEDLLSYLKGRVKPGGLFLAYYNIPTLYFLTHTRPAYSSVWAHDGFWSMKTLERLAREMDQANKYPPYAVRMITNPWSDWDTPRSFDCQQENQSCPLDRLVNSHYYIEKVIYPFEVWKKGPGPKLKIYYAKKPDFQTSFSDWTESTIINAKSLNYTHLPFRIFETESDFTLAKVKSDTDSFLQVTTIGDSYPAKIEFGYYLSQKGINLKVEPGDVVNLIITAKLSYKDSAYPFYNSTLFIDDGGDSRNSIAIYRSIWDSYIVSKKIKDYHDIRVGLSWEPSIKTQQLDIKDLRIIIEKSH